MIICRHCRDIFDRLYRIPCSVACISTILVQNGLMDYFLVKNNNLFWCFWAVADLAVLALFLTAFVLSHRHLKQRSSILVANEPTPLPIPGELPLGYIAWFSYSVIISIKICILYGPGFNIVGTMPKPDQLDPNYLRTSVALSSIVFFLLVVTHHDAKPRSDRESYISNIAGQVTIDVLDTTNFLNVLFTQETKIILEFSMQRAVVAFACINLILPTMLLLALSRTQFGRISLSDEFDFLHKVVYFLVVNFPMLVIRCMIWKLKDDIISVFLIKNVIGLGLIIKTITDHLCRADDPTEDTSENYEPLPNQIEE